MSSNISNKLEISDLYLKSTEIFLNSTAISILILLSVLKLNCSVTTGFASLLSISICTKLLFQLTFPLILLSILDITYSFG